MQFYKAEHPSLSEIQIEIFSFQILIYFVEDSYIALLSTMASE